MFLFIVFLGFLLFCWSVELFFKGLLLRELFEYIFVVWKFLLCFLENVNVVEDFCLSWLVFV